MSIHSLKHNNRTVKFYYSLQMSVYYRIINEYNSLLEDGLSFTNIDEAIKDMENYDEKKKAQKETA